MAELRARQARVRSVERALLILLYLVERPGSSLVQLAREVGISKSTAHRLLTTLQALGVVARDADSRTYRLGPRMRSFERPDHAHLDVRTTALSEMERLRDLSGETVTLHLRDRSAHLVIEQVESRHEIRRVHPVLVPIPLLTGATAKAILSALPLEEAHAILAANCDHDEQRPSDDELRDINKVGYALSTGERVAGACALSVPIRDRGGAVWGALSIAGPAFRFSPARALLHASALTEAAERISLSLEVSTGYPQRLTAVV